MVTDERGGSLDCTSIDAVSFDELKDAFKRLALDYSKQSIDLRMLRIQNDEQRKWLIENRTPESSLERIRSQTLANFLASLPPIKGVAGRKRSYQDEAKAYALWAAYEKLDEPKPSLRTWLRLEIERDYKECNASSVVRKNEISRVVQRWSTKISRLNSRLLRNLS